MGGSADWRGDRLETSYAEARRLLEAHRSTLADIDSKAVSTVRITVLVIGLVVTVAEVADPALFHPHLFALGIGSLLLATVAGVFTYAESDLFLGPNREYLRVLARGDLKAWDEDLVVRLADWIEENRRDVRRNGRLLFLTQT